MKHVDVDDDDPKESKEEHAGLAFGAWAPIGKGSPAKRTPCLLPRTSMRVGRCTGTVSNPPSYNNNYFVNITNFCINLSGYLRIRRLYECFLRLTPWRDEEPSESAEREDGRGGADQRGRHADHQPIQQELAAGPSHGARARARTLASAGGRPGAHDNVSLPAIPFVKPSINLQFYLPALATRVVMMSKTTPAARWRDIIIRAEIWTRPRRLAYTSATGDIAPAAAVTPGSLVAPRPTEWIRTSLQTTTKPGSFRNCLRNCPSDTSIVNIKTVPGLIAKSKKKMTLKITRQALPQLMDHTYAATETVVKVGNQLIWAGPAYPTTEVTVVKVGNQLIWAGPVLPTAEAEEEPMEHENYEEIETNMILDVANDGSWELVWTDAEVLVRENHNTDHLAKEGIKLEPETEETDEELDTSQPFDVKEEPKGEEIEPEDGVASVPPPGAGAGEGAKGLSNDSPHTEPNGRMVLAEPEDRAGGVPPPSAGTGEGVKGLSNDSPHMEPNGRKVLAERQINTLSGLEKKSEAKLVTNKVEEDAENMKQEKN